MSCQAGNGILVVELEAFGLQPVRTLPVAPFWCDLGFFPNSRGNKAAENLHRSTTWTPRDYQRARLPRLVRVTLTRSQLSQAPSSEIVWAFPRLAAQRNLANGSCRSWQGPPATCQSQCSGCGTEVPLWAFRLRAVQDSDCRVQPRQTDAVDRRTRSKRL